MFKLNGFAIPESGNPAKPWEVTYYVEPAGHSFTAVFEGGVAVRITSSWVSVWHLAALAMERGMGLGCGIRIRFETQ